MKKWTKVWPAVFMGTMWPKESAEKAVQLNLQLILDCIRWGRKFKRSALEHNLKSIVNAMERAGLLTD